MDAVWMEAHVFVLQRFPGSTPIRSLLTLGRLMPAACYSRELPDWAATASQFTIDRRRCS